MDPLAFVLVVASAVSHALWNYLVKGVEEKQSFMILLNVMALLLFLPVFYVLLPQITLPFEILPYLIISGASETLYFIALGRAYEKGDLSVVYPLARSSPLFLTIAAVLFLHERVTTWGVLGILLVFIGVYTLHFRNLKLEDLALPLRSLREPAPLYAVVAALGTTVYSITDKLGVTTVDPLLYAFWLGFFVTGMLTLTTVLRNGIGGLRGAMEGSILRAAAAGFLMKGGYILVLIAMSLAQVSYILALRQVSVVLGAVLGVILLKERYAGMRIISSTIIFLGVYVLGALA